MFLCVVGNCLLFYCSCTGNWNENNDKLKEVDISNDGKIGNIQIVNKVFVNGEYKALVDVSIYRGSTGKDYNGAKNEFLKSINNR